MLYHSGYLDNEDRSSELYKRHWLSWNYYLDRIRDELSIQLNCDIAFPDAIDHAMIVTFIKKCSHSYTFK